MFQQVIGDGANIFIIIVAVLVGFGVGMGYTEYVKTARKEKKD